MTEQAVTFDPNAFRVWLDTPAGTTEAGSETNREGNPFLRTGYQRLDGEAGWMVENVLHQLHTTRSRPHPSVGPAWAYGEGVSEVRVWATACPEGGPDGGLAGQVTVDGAPLAIARMADKELVPPLYDLLPGYEAAEHALTALAERVNEIVSRYRPTHRPAGPLGELDADDVECALRTLAEYHLESGEPDLSIRQQEVADKVVGLLAADDDDEDDDDN